jgi:hypothetical protein
MSQMSSNTDAKSNKLHKKLCEQITQLEPSNVDNINVKQLVSPRLSTTPTDTHPLRKSFSKKDIIASLNLETSDKERAELFRLVCDQIRSSKVDYSGVVSLVNKKSNAQKICTELTSNVNSN